MEYSKTSSWTRAALNYKLVQALRKVYFMWPIRHELLRENKISLIKMKKDGTPSKRNDVWYPCHYCGEQFKQKNIAVDHIEPVVPLNTPQSLLGTDQFPWGDYIKRLFCAKENLWLLCENCHTVKTMVEKHVRKQWAQYRKGNSDSAPNDRRIGKDFATYATEYNIVVTSKSEKR